MLLALVALKLVVVSIDPTIRLYLGDSAAYLFGAMDNGRLPDDRSFTYSLLIQGLVRPFDALWPLLWWQTLAGVITCALVWQIMVSRLGVSPRLATLAACLLAIEPAQLYYERMVLAETFGLLAFVMFFAFTAAYVSSGRVWWLASMAPAGLAAVSFRLNYLPVVLVISLVAPLLRSWVLAGPPRTRVVAHSLIAIVIVGATHAGYQQWVAWIFKSPPGYIARAGFMQLGLVMPLVQPQHLARVGLAADFGEQLRFRLDDPDNRMSHMWAPGGFVRTLRERQVAIEPLARALARMALADDPFGIVRLGVHTVGNYFREEEISHALENDLGRRVIPDEILWTLRERWQYDAHGLWMRTTAVSWYFERGTWMLVTCLFILAPLVMATAWMYRLTPMCAQAYLLALVGVGLVLAHVLFVPVAFYRYLHPLPAFVLIAASAVLTHAWRVKPGA